MGAVLIQITTEGTNSWSESQNSDVVSMIIQHQGALRGGEILELQLMSNI